MRGDEGGAHMRGDEGRAHVRGEVPSNSASCRLDRLVSGVLLLARSSAVASVVCNLILQRKVTKEYVARVKVCVSHDIDIYIYL